MIISTFIDILGQLIDLFKLRTNYKENIFETFVEPLYIEVEKIIPNYLLLYENIYDSIQKGSSRRNAIFDSLSKFDIKYAKGKNDPNLSEESGSNESDDAAWSRREISREFEIERRTLYHARVKVVELASVYSNSNLDEQIKIFTKNVANIFGKTTDSNKATFEYHSEVVSKILSEEEEDLNLLNKIEKITSEIREGWEMVSAQYAELKLKYNKPIFK